MNEIAILMQHEKFDDFAQNLSCFSTKNKTFESKKIWDDQVSQRNNNSLSKIKDMPLLQEPLSQPVLSVELFISYLIVYI